MKKVLFLLITLEMGGAEKVIINIANKLNKKIFQVSIFAFFKQGELEKTIDADVNVEYGFDVKCHRMVCLVPALLKRLEKYKDYDLVVAGLEIWPTYIVALYSFLHPVKSIAWVHTNLEPYMKQYNLLKRWILKGFNAISYRKINYIFSVSERCRVCGPKSEKNFIVPNSFNRNFIAEQANEDVKEDFFSQKIPLILSVSRVAKIKNIQLLIKAHAKLLSDGVVQEIIVVGKGEDLIELKELCKMLNVSSTVHFLGEKLNPYPYFKRCDVFVNCSLIEGFSLTGVEAMLLGIPLVTTDYPNACAELVENNVSGIVVKNNSVDSLADGIRRLLDDDNLREKLIQNGRGAVERFDEKRIIREIEDYFCELTKNDSERDF